MTDVLISPCGQTQQELEEILTIGLRVVRPSPQCEEVIVPFLCLYYLRPCDGGGEVSYHPSVEDCVTVSTEICAREWAVADDLVSSLGESLPSCEELRTYTSGDGGITIPGMQTSFQQIIDCPFVQNYEVWMLKTIIYTASYEWLLA